MLDNSLSLKTEICSQEPITRLDLIQDFGFLVALTNDWMVVRASANLEAHTGITPAMALGTFFSTWITAAALDKIRGRMSMIYATGSEQLYGVELLAGRPSFDLAVHFQDSLLIIEAEPSQKSDMIEAASTVRMMTGQLARTKSFADFFRFAARHAQVLTGFDRVMIYRFDEADNGEVIAEATRAGMESFLGLHYPSSDIPPQARALYLVNPFRIIADVASVPVPILPTGSASTVAVDLSLAITRSVSPYHIEYLRNMGVGASLSISIVVKGRLWGLIACHAQAATLPSFVMRTAAELFGAMFSMMLETRLQEDSATEEHAARKLAERLITAISANNALLSDPQWLMEMSSDMIACDGVGIFRDGKVASFGATPADDGIRTFAKYLDLTSPSQVFTTDRLGAIDPGLAAGAAAPAGCMAIPISRTPRDYVILFRNELVREIKWGGDPAEPMAVSDDGLRVSPRKSFEAFRENARGQAAPFSARDQRVAETIRQSLVEVILRNLELQTAERSQAADRQNLLIAELNHRVRNILALIRSLISQSESDGQNVGDYVGSLHGRIQSLARAHDRITAQNWGPASLFSLFKDEIDALPGGAERIRFTGPDIDLLPMAVSTMALVLHELVTNSCKYGALSQHGHVEVRTQAVPDGVTMGWRCVGGPPVKAPTRRGFGSVLIERSVPFDLQGTATVRYEVSGFEADFFIPQQYVHHVHDTTAAAPPPGLVPGQVDAAAGAVAADLPLTGKTVLLVEDTMLIALEAESMLLDLGAAKIVMAASLPDAEAAIAAQDFDFAMLDVNLGTATTFGLAAKLTRRGIPHVFASGYGEEVALRAGHPNTLVIQKPYQQEHLRDAVNRAIVNAAAH